MSLIRVAIAEDRASVREYLCNQIKQAGDVELVGVATSASETLDLIQCSRPDVLILDLEMPAMGGYQVLCWLNQENIPTKVIVLSPHRERWLVRETERLGVWGIITKDQPADQILNVVRSVQKSTAV